MRKNHLKLAKCFLPPFFLLTRMDFQRKWIHASTVLFYTIYYYPTIHPFVYPSTCKMKYGCLLVVLYPNWLPVLLLLDYTFFQIEWRNCMNCRPCTSFKLMHKTKMGQKLNFLFFSDYAAIQVDDACLCDIVGGCCMLLLVFSSPWVDALYLCDDAEEDCCANSTVLLSAWKKGGFM